MTKLKMPSIMSSWYKLRASCKYTWPWCSQNSFKSSMPTSSTMVAPMMPVKQSAVSWGSMDSASVKTVETLGLERGKGGGR